MEQFANHNGGANRAVSKKGKRKDDVMAEHLAQFERPEGVGRASQGCAPALRATSIQKLVTSGALQLSLFDTLDLAEITHPDYAGSRGGVQL